MLLKYTSPTRFLVSLGIQRVWGAWVYYVKVAGVLALVNLQTHQRVKVESVEYMAGNMCNLFLSF